jgi:hypothetical protein
VIFDGPAAEEQLGGNVFVAAAGGYQPGHSEFLRGEHVERAHVPLAGGFPGGAQFGVRSLGPQRRAHAVEGVERAAQLDSRIGSPPGAAQALAVGELGPCALIRWHPVVMVAKGCGEQVFGLLIMAGQHGTAALEHPVHQRGPAHRRPGREPRQRSRGPGGLADPERRVDVLGGGKQRDGGKRAGIDLVEVLDRLGRVPQLQLQDPQCHVCLARRIADAGGQTAAHGRGSALTAFLFLAQQRGDPGVQGEIADLVVLVTQLAGELEPFGGGVQPGLQPAHAQLAGGQEEQRSGQPGDRSFGPVLRDDAGETIPCRRVVRQPQAEHPGHGRHHGICVEVSFNPHRVAQPLPAERASPSRTAWAPSSSVRRNSRRLPPLRIWSSTRRASATPSATHRP